MSFSERMGLVPDKAIQIGSVDLPLKNSIWNILKIYVFDPTFEADRYSSYSRFDLLCLSMWHSFYKSAIDEMPTNKLNFIRNRFFNDEWYRIYDLLEFLVNVKIDNLPIDIIKFKDTCNNILARELSGYRFIDDLIAPITNTNEIAQIEEAISRTAQFTPLKGANIHLNAALVRMSDRKSPDYRNSIKESISAVEAVTKVISNKPGDTLGSALDKIQGKISLHTALKHGFKQLYGYTSDSDGIRHALMDQSTCDVEDAEYMLVSCSAFINYLLIKVQKAGITLNKTA